MKVVLSGCSGGGKFTLLSALAQRGYATVPEPGSRIVDAAAPDDPALPWNNGKMFLATCMQMAIADHRIVTGPTFFDRSLLDAACGLARLGPMATDVALALQTCRYNPTVYLTPPWSEIFVQDAARRYGFADAVMEYNALCDWLPKWGYLARDIPRLSVEDRVGWLLQDLQQNVRATEGLL